jgi:hypothetical protein
MMRHGLVNTLDRFLNREMWGVLRPSLHRLIVLKINIIVAGFVPNGLVGSNTKNSFSAAGKVTGPVNVRAFLLDSDGGGADQ